MSHLDMEVYCCLFDTVDDDSVETHLDHQLNARSVEFGMNDIGIFVPVVNANPHLPPR